MTSFQFSKSTSSKGMSFGSIARTYTLIDAELLLLGTKEVKEETANGWKPKPGRNDFKVTERKESGVARRAAAFRNELGHPSAPIDAGQSAESAGFFQVITRSSWL
jgi:hypothetical protein